MMQTCHKVLPGIGHAASLVFRFVGRGVTFPDPPEDSGPRERGSWWTKEKHAAYHRKYYHENLEASRERSRKQARKWRIANLDLARKRVREATARWRARQKGKRETI